MFLSSYSNTKGSLVQRQMLWKHELQGHRLTHPLTHSPTRSSSPGPWRLRMQCYNNDHYFLGLLCLLVKVIDEVQKRFWLDKLSPWYVYSHPAAWKTISIYAKLQKLRPYPAEERTKSVTSHTRMLTTGRDMGKRCEQSEDRFQITRRTHSVHSKNHMAELTDLSRNSFQCVPTRASDRG